MCKGKCMATLPQLEALPGSDKSHFIPWALN